MKLTEEDILDLIKSEKWAGRSFTQIGPIDYDRAVELVAAMKSLGYDSSVIPWGHMAKIEVKW